MLIDAFILYVMPNLFRIIGYAIAWVGIMLVVDSFATVCGALLIFLGGHMAGFDEGYRHRDKKASQP
jgi:positive regulator of sigma E activity